MQYTRSCFAGKSPAFDHPCCLNSLFSPQTSVILILLNCGLYRLYHTILYHFFAGSMPTNAYFFCILLVSTGNPSAFHVQVFIKAQLPSSSTIYLCFSMFSHIFPPSNGPIPCLWGKELHLHGLCDPFAWEQGLPSATGITRLLWDSMRQVGSKII